MPSELAKKIQSTIAQSTAPVTNAVIQPAKFTMAEAQDKMNRLITYLNENTKVKGNNAFFFVRNEAVFGKGKTLWTYKTALDKGDESVIEFVMSLPEKPDLSTTKFNFESPEYNELIAPLRSREDMELENAQRNVSMSNLQRKVNAAGSGNVIAPGPKEM